MASIGHIAVGMAAARVYRRRPQAPRWPLSSTMLLWSVLSLLPDVDVIGFRLGIAYGDPWGHRGATHSLLFALAGGLAAGAVARAFALPLGRTFALATLVLVSHALLDTLTDGGLGCALLWPLDNTRYFAPYTPIPVAPIGWAFFTARGWPVALTELWLFSPLLMYALWPRRDPPS